MEITHNLETNIKAACRPKLRHGWKGDYLNNHCRTGRGRINLCKRRTGAKTARTFVWTVTIQRRREWCASKGQELNLFEALRAISTTRGAESFSHAATHPNARCRSLSPAQRIVCEHCMTTVEVLGTLLNWTCPASLTYLHSSYLASLAQTPCQRSPSASAGLVLLRSY